MRLRSALFEDLTKISEPLYSERLNSILNTKTTEKIVTIKMKPQEFPEKRLHDPKRQAEVRAFEALANMQLDGCGIYELRCRPDGQQVDFALWADFLGRYAAQVKGGEYRWDDDEKWYLKKPDGQWERKPSPLHETVDGCIEMHDAIKQATGFYAYVAGILILPDTARDRELERLALNRDGVYICWDLDRLEEDLERVAERVNFRRPPKRSHSDNESTKVYKLQRRAPGDQKGIGRRQAVPTGGAELNSSLEQAMVVGTAIFNIERLDQMIVHQYYLNPDSEGNIQIPEE